MRSSFGKYNMDVAIFLRLGTIVIGICLSFTLCSKKITLLQICQSTLKFSTNFRTLAKFGIPDEIEVLCRINFDWSCVPKNLVLELASAPKLADL